jgi:hypothetical protein
MNSNSLCHLHPVPEQQNHVEELKTGGLPHYFYHPLSVFCISAVTEIRVNLSHEKLKQNPVVMCLSTCTYDIIFMVYRIL